MRDSITPKERRKVMPNDLPFELRLRERHSVKQLIAEAEKRNEDKREKRYLLYFVNLKC